MERIIAQISPGTIAEIFAGISACMLAVLVFLLRGFIHWLKSHVEANKAEHEALNMKVSDHELRLVKVEADVEHMGERRIARMGTQIQ